MSALTEDKVFVPPFRKPYFASPPVHSLDRLAETPSTTPELTARTSPDSSNEDIPSRLYPGIAVVGMACRVAGENTSPDKLWDFLMACKDGCGELDRQRWEPYQKRNRRNTKELDKITSRGYFVPNIADFDNMFFGISPKEAENMDPQQRISLEVCWEALESAGIPPQSLAGSNTAVYMGVNSDDYGKLLLEDLPGIEAWMGIGTAYCGIPNRISYHLDLMGPSTAVDAACASSLVAIHHGRQSLLAGETDLAIVGGVNALYGPGLTKVLDKAGAVSPEGLCRSFDDDSKGYGRGEGAGIVILKRMDDALKDHDNIIAVLKGSAVGQDGRTNGIMAPNGKAQELVAKQALDAGGIEPLSVGYIEAHATSTPVGDPVEVAAMSEVYGKGRQAGKPCLIGSIKPNIGHLEAGAGVMGFIKAIMAVKNGVVPPQANLNKLNTRVNWEEAGLQVVREPTKWKEMDIIRRAGICSYGYGGTVSHAIVEEFGDNQERFTVPGRVNEESRGEMVILTFSAPQEKRIATQAEVLASWIIGDGSQHSLSSIATTLATRRGHHDYRAAIVASCHEEAAEALKAFTADSETSKAVSRRVVASSNSHGSVWVFSGHGAQWKEMGQELILNPIFNEAISVVEETVQTEADFSALQALRDGDMESSDKVQVLTYVMQIGLAAMLKSKGVTPQAIIGHSVGEIAASVVAGALTVREGALIVCRRAVLYRKVMGRGTMVLISRPFAEIQAELGERNDIVAAIDSSPSSCVVSGLTDIVADFSETWKARGIKVIKVKTDIAFHSPSLRELVEPLSESLAGSLKPKQPSVQLYSTSLTDPRGHDLRDSKYWTNNMINPVLLTQAVTALASDNFKVFLEVSTHPIVSHSVEEILLNVGSEDPAVLTTMNRGQSAEFSILLGIASLHCAGVPISWKSQVAMSGDWAHHVPLTHWVRQRHVKRVSSEPLNNSNGHDSDAHTLLGQRISIPGVNLTVYTTRLSEGTRPFPGQHPLHGTEIVPAAVLINTFYHGTGKRDLHDIVLRVPVALSAPRDIQLTRQQGQVKLSSRLVQEGEEVDEAVEDQSWVTHTTGRYDDKARLSANDDTMDIAAVKARIGARLKDSFSIDYLAGVGVSAMGFPWAVTEHFGTEKEMMARVDVSPDTKEGAPLPWDKSSWAPILDAATSIGSTLFFGTPRLRMPAQVSTVRFCSSALPPKTGYIHVLPSYSNAELAVDVSILDSSGHVLVNILEMRFAEMEGTIGASGSVESLVHQISWPPMPLTEEPLVLGHVIVVSRDQDAVERSRTALKERASFRSYTSVSDLREGSASASSPEKKTTILLYLPEEVASSKDVASAGSRFCSELLDMVKYAASITSAVKVFAMTSKVMKGVSATALAHAPLHGLGRIIAAEQSDIWGAIIDTEDSDWAFPLQAIKYAQGGDIVRIRDGVARAPVLRRLPHDKKLPSSGQQTTLPRPEGTYLITGGLGALGLEVAKFLVENNARRLVLISRRAFPARRFWKEAQGHVAEVCRTIERLEDMGATIYVLSVDIAGERATENLHARLDSLALPPVLGVVHAAGVLEDQLILESTRESFNRVLAPKVTGSMTLHESFPVGTLDFMVLFSSCGQLFGFPGQGSYASGNAFLDTLAAHRRNQGDNCVAFQWTSWRGMGMAASTDFINAELESKGITDVTKDEAFRAWEHLSKYDVDHGVVLRSRALDASEPLPAPILADIAVRKQDDRDGAGAGAQSQKASSGEVPKSGPALLEYLDVAIRTCVAQTLQLTSPDDVDPKAALSDLGVDSVMAVALRTQLQKSLGVKMPPTLMWSLPTASHLQKWFMEQLEEK
ncbi:MAG: hypothetical protein Q9195_005272 [Heterodermia aff. obscurata]